MMPQTRLRPDALIPAALIALVAVPVAVGVARVVELASGAEVTPDNARFVAAPVSLVLHVFGTGVFTLLGAFQFARRFRRLNPTWHRRAGWLSIIAGFIAGFSGLWMTQFYPPVPGDGPLLYGLRLLFGSLLVIFLLLALFALRQRDFARHGAWMTRGYAIALGAGTQFLVHLPWFLIAGRPGELARALLVGAGWSINLAVAEWIIVRRKGAAARARRDGRSLPRHMGDGASPTVAPCSPSSPLERMGVAQLRGRAQNSSRRTVPRADAGERLREIDRTANAQRV